MGLSPELRGAVAEHVGVRDVSPPSEGLEGHIDEFDLRILRSQLHRGKAADRAVRDGDGGLIQPKRGRKPSHPRRYDKPATNGLSGPLARSNRTPALLTPWAPTDAHHRASGP